MRFFVATLALAATSALAQDLGALGSLSSSCSAAAADLLTSSMSTCANLLQLTSLATTTRGSLIDALELYINGVCTKAPCPDSAVTTAAGPVRAGCAFDVRQDQPIALALDAVLGDYPDSRSLLCSLAIANRSYCLPQTLRSIEAASGINMTLASVTALVKHDDTQSFVDLIDSIPPSTYCTECSHAIVTLADRVVAKASPSNAGLTASSVAVRCGSVFANGQVPASVSTTGMTPPPPTGAAAASAVAPLLSVVAMIGVGALLSV